MVAAPKLIRPASLDAALAVLDRGAVNILAGGTDFFPMQMDIASVAAMDLSRLPELGAITDLGAHWRIGAAVTWAQLIAAHLPPAFDGLKAAARQIGSVQIQNTATLVGNICNASPAADGVPALLTLEAAVEIRSLNAVRQMPLQAFITGVRKISLDADELVTAIIIPKSACLGQSAFEKLGSRQYLVISIVSVAVRLVVDDGGVIQLARVAVGSCSPVACRLHDLEAGLLATKAGEISRVVKAADFTPLSPISDVRASATYRLEAAREMVARTLVRCLQERSDHD